MLLNGGVRPPPLTRQIGSPLLYLPFSEQLSVAEAWFNAFTMNGVAHQDCVLASTPNDASTLYTKLSPFRLTHDTDPYRGPAGALRDATRSLSDVTVVIVAEGTRLPPSNLVERLLQVHTPGTITLGVSKDRTYAGTLATDPAAIDLLPGIGFIDLKEQWIPTAVKSGFRVRSCALPEASYRVRTRESYLGAMAQLGRFADVSGTGARVIGGNDDHMFGHRYGGSLIFHSASVASDAVVSHSVVAAGARVGPGAIVVRSVIGPGARVRDHEVVLDRVLGGTDTSPSRASGGFGAKKA